MIDTALWIIFAATSAALTTVLVTPTLASIAKHYDALDRPGGRKTHARPIPRLGGIAVLLGIAVAVALVALGQGSSLDLGGEIPQVRVLLASTGLVLLAGLIDDLRHVPAVLKLLWELVAATLLVVSAASWTFSQLGLPGGSTLELGALGAPLTVLWIVGICNSINLMDGFDGLAAGVSAIVATTFLAYAVIMNDLLVAAVMAGMAGACTGFLVHNRAPATIFLGDAGSLPLGFLLGALSVHTATRAPVEAAVLVPMLALSVPAIDMVLVAAFRFRIASARSVKARVVRVLRADRNHLHHALATLLQDDRLAVATIYAGVAASAVAALAIALTRTTSLGFAILAVEILTILVVRVLGLRRSRKSERWAPSAAGSPPSGGAPAASDGDSCGP